MDSQIARYIWELMHSFIQMLNYFHMSKSGCMCLVWVIYQFNFRGEGGRQGGDSWEHASGKPSSAEMLLQQQQKEGSLPSFSSPSGYVPLAHKDELCSCVCAPTLMLSRFDISTKCPCNMGLFELYQSQIHIIKVCFQVALWMQGQIQWPCCVRHVWSHGTGCMYPSFIC